MNNVDVHVGARVREKRFQARLTVAVLASRAGVGAAQLLRYENGQERIPAQILVKLCRTLDMPVSHVFDMTPGRPGDQRAAGFRIVGVDRPSPHPRPHIVAKTREILPQTREMLMQHDALIARQAGIVARLECDGPADLAQLGRQTQALPIRDVERFGLKTEEPPVGDAGA